MPLTTKFIGDVFGAFLGAYVGGLIFDKKYSYTSLWYAALAMSVFAVVADFFVGEDRLDKL